MAYKYIDLGTPPYMGTTKSEFTNGFQAMLDENFQNATTYQTIQEEGVFASGSFTDVNVRVNTAVSSITGQFLGDDFKRILFQDLDHATGIGYKYYFDNNFWIAVFSETIKNIAASCMVRRCNTRLRWMTTSGSYYEEPCSIDYKISRPRDSIGTENPVLPQGFIDVYAQLNSRTRLIKPNQRFLFGPKENRIALRVFGTGIQNALNQETMDDQSSRLAVYSMGGNYINNDTDNVELGIADYYLDFDRITTGSMAGAYSIIVNPNENKILEGQYVDYNVNYYLGNIIQSGSFVFSISGSSVPSENYSMTTLGPNSFRILNNKQWLTSELLVLCSGSSGSRIANLELRGSW